MRAGRSRDAADGAHDGRGQHRPRGLHQRARCSRRRSSRSGCRCASSTRPARRSATEQVTFISPSVDDAHADRAREDAARRRAAARFRTDQFVRAQIVFWTTAPALTAPVVACNRINGQYFVFVAEAGPSGGLVAQPAAGDGRPGRRQRLRRRRRPQGRRQADRRRASRRSATASPVQPLPAGRRRRAAGRRAGERRRRASRRCSATSSSAGRSSRRSARC